jgi:hypothetical protein
MAQDKDLVTRLKELLEHTARLEEAQRVLARKEKGSSKR